MSKHQPQENIAEQQIDNALRLLAQAQPPAHLEQRIHARLHHEQLVSRRSLFDSFVSQRIVFASVAAALACCAIVIGSVQHSRQRGLPATGVHLSAPDRGIGAASGTHIAPQPIPVPEHTHSRSERKGNGGRATVSRDTHKPKGVAVPQSTEPEKP